MSDIKDGGFKLDPKQFHTKNIVVNGAVDSVVDMLNKLDVNHDGQRDIAQVAPVVLHCVPVAVELVSMVDWDKAKLFLVEHHLVNPAQKSEFLSLLDLLLQKAKPLEQFIVKPAPKE